MPSGDRAFRHAVEAVLDDPPERDARGQLPAAAIEERLRPLFPRVAVFERGLSGELPGVYVYREGHFRAEPGDAWWTEPSTSRARVSIRTGRLTSVHRPLDARACPVEAVVGRPFSEFVSPSARSIASALFELVAHGELRSRALVTGADGRPFEIEYRAVRDGAEIEVSYRPARKPAD